MIPILRFRPTDASMHDRHYKCAGQQPPTSECAWPMDASNRGQGMVQVTEHFLCLLFVPLLLGRPRASGSCSQGQGTLCWGRPSGGTDKAESRRPAGRRALTPKQSQTEEDRKADTDLRDRNYRSDFKGWTDLSAPACRPRGRECPQQTSRRLPCEFWRLGGCRVGGDRKKGTRSEFDAIGPQHLIRPPATA